MQAGFTCMASMKGEYLRLVHAGERVNPIYNISKMLAIFKQFSKKNKHEITISYESLEKSKGREVLGGGIFWSQVTKKYQAMQL